MIYDVQEKKKQKNIILNFLIIICLAIFAFSGYKLISYYLEYKSMDKVYSNLNALVIEDVDLTPDDHGLLLRAPKIDMKKLKEINPDVVGYIIIPDTKISYPILYNSDMTKYIDHDVEMNYSRAGAIFMDANNHPSFIDDNTIIYGHQMKDGSMFGDITTYFRDTAYASNHSYIYLYTENGIRLYRIFAGRMTEATSDVYTTHFTYQEKLSFINEQMRHSAFESTYVPTGDENFITLSTCTNITKTSRYVLFAQLVEVIPQS